MLKLLQGVVSFHETVLPGLVGQFAKLAEGQYPDAWMIACSDSRVAPNVFASTDPGDLVVTRNIGNLIPPAPQDKGKPNGSSEAAAVAIAVSRLKVKDIIVCGHSLCAGMAGLLNEDGIEPDLREWVRHGKRARRQLDEGRTFDPSLSPQDQLSQLNVMAQLDNLRTYPQVADALTAGALRLHGWWFDIATGNVHAFEPDENRFVVIDKNVGARILDRIRT